jgi:hypothetical protein
MVNMGKSGLKLLTLDKMSCCAKCNSKVISKAVTEVQAKNSLIQTCSGMVHEMVDDMSLICVPPVVQLKLLIISA